MTSVIAIDQGPPAPRRTGCATTARSKPSRASSIARSIRSKAGSSTTRKSWRDTSRVRLSTQGLHLITADIAGARSQLLERGAEVSDLWHDADGIFHWAGSDNRVAGAHPDADSYGTYASFSDPDGNGWVLQQIVTRAPGR